MTRHRMYKTQEYRVWLRIKTACFNKSNKAYRTYGLRGIGMDAEWKDSFRAFLRDMGKCPDGCTGIELIDMNKDFNKYNCRWVGRLTRRALADMPRQKMRRQYRRYKNPKKITITVEQAYFEHLQRMAIEKSRQIGEPIAAIDMIKGLIYTHFPHHKQEDFTETM